MQVEGPVEPLLAGLLLIAYCIDAVVGERSGRENTVMVVLLMAMIAGLPSFLEVEDNDGRKPVRTAGARE